MPADHPRPKKRLRASRACDFCHKRSIKCHPGLSGSSSCQNCYDFDIPCTYDRPLKRGRTASGCPHSKGPVPAAAISAETQRQNQRLSPSPLEPAMQEVDATAEAVADQGSRSPLLGRSSKEYVRAKGRKGLGKDSPGTAWRAFAAASASTIEYLVDVYLRVVYPIFPLFHQPTLLRNVRDQEYLCNRASFASLMAACALASARGRDGAIYGSTQEPSYMVTVSSETFYSAAIDALPEDLIVAREFDYMRACALLSIVSIQYGDIEAMQLYLGNYFTLAAIHRFHDEACWPSDITNIEVEERRRLYWSTYTLDVYSSIVWNGSVHAYGTNARVHYPSEVEDELIMPLANLPSPQLTTSWLRGWNFTTDLYLTLEHAYHRMRAREAPIDKRIDIAALFGMPVFSSSTVLASINAYYAALPAHFKIFTPPTGDRNRDIFGFQAANIQATMLLLRMLFLRTDDDCCGPPDVQLKCNVAAELLAVFEAIPTAYLRGISTPLIYHLAGIGTILGSVMESPLSEVGYQKAKGMLLSIADLLERLESGLSRAADISKGLRAQIERIDEYMRVQFRPIGRSYTHDHTTSFNTTDLSVPQLPQHVGAVEVGSMTGCELVAGTEGMGAESEGELQHGWLDEFQLPPELLEDWPWPLNQQLDSWTLLGSG